MAYDMLPVKDGVFIYEAETQGGMLDEGSGIWKGSLGGIVPSLMGVLRGVHYSMTRKGPFNEPFLPKLGFPKFLMVAHCHVLECPIGC